MLYGERGGQDRKISGSVASLLYSAANIRDPIPTRQTSKTDN